MSEWRFKLLYDGDCPLCRREVNWLLRFNRAGHLEFEDIAAAAFDPSRYGTTREELMRVMHGVFPDGRIVREVEAFRQAYRAVGLGWLAAPTGWPILRPIFDRLYSLFARNRVRFGRVFGRSCNSGACGVPTNRVENRI
jgi:predicted DCC family thiol-disulfide oxidoreductase YuxK